MLKKSMDNSYLLSDKDLIIALQYAYQYHDTNYIQMLSTLFSTVDDIETVNNEVYHKINDTALIDYLLLKVKIANDETYIDYNILKEGYIISKYEKNHEMNRKIWMYLRNYIHNEIKGEENDILIAEIVNDKPLLHYLKRYENLDDYIIKQINKEIVKKDKSKQEVIKQKKIA